MESKNLDPRTVRSRQLEWLRWLPLRHLSLHHLLVILFGFSLAMPLTSCGGGADEAEEEEEEEDELADEKPKKKRSKRSGSKKRSKSDDDSSKSKAIALYKKLKGDGLKEDFPDEFSRAYRYIKNGEKYADDDESSKAERSYKRAISVLQDIVDSAGEAEGVAADAQKEQKLAEEARKKADALDAAANAADTYKDAVEYYEKGLELAKSGETDSLEEAIVNFKDATSYFEDAIEEAEVGAKNRILADRSKELMGTYKSKAKQNEADIKALTQWQQGEQLELQAATNYESGDFQLAAQQFNQASSIYTAALRSVLDDQAFADQMRAAKAEEEKRREQWAKEQAAIAAAQGGGAVPPPPPPSGGGDAPIPPDRGGTVVTNPPPIGIGGVVQGPIASCARDLATKFPQKIDEEDEAFLIENLHHLSKVARYDPETGGIELDYTDGRKLAKEIEVGRTSSRYLVFKDPMMPPVAGDVPESALATMAGNTAGFVYIPVPLLYKVRVSWEFSVQTMTQTGQFGAFVSFDKSRKSRIRTNFADIGIVQGGRAPKWRKHPTNPGSKANYWHTKLRPVQWVVDFESEAPDGKSSLTTIYDQGGEEEFPNKVSGKLSHSGFVGFEWKETKFMMKKLKICAFLDKEKAVEMLRKKLGEPKKKSSDKDEPEEGDDDDDAEEEDVTVPKDDAAEKPKVDDEDFDF